MRIRHNTFITASILMLFIYASQNAWCIGMPTSNKKNDVMPAGYMNAPLQQARDMKPVEKVKKERSPEPAKNNAKWMRNPNDERGQGNMGKVTMRDPYGFDKCGYRMESARGRRMEAALLDPEGVTIGKITIMDAQLNYFESTYNYWKDLYDSDPSHPYAQTFMEIWKEPLDKYTSNTYEFLVAGWNMSGWEPSVIEYGLEFNVEPEFIGTTLEVKILLTSVNDYDGEYGLHYDAGEAIVEETQTIILGENTVMYYYYNPPMSLVDKGEGFIAAFSVIVTEPESGVNYTINYDNPLFVYRWLSLGYNW
ncbi:MAG: hypothetical protein ABH862_03590 [Candidatus Omnitrophota bacterium]